MLKRSKQLYIYLCAAEQVNVSEGVSVKEAPSFSGAGPAPQAGLVRSPPASNEAWGSCWLEPGGGTAASAGSRTRVPLFPRRLL